MKKTLLLTTLTSMALAANAAKSPYQDKDYSHWGKLQLVGNQLSDSKGEPVQLKGWSTFSLHYGEVQGCLGKGQWELMKQYGANIVRLAMYIDESNSYIGNESMFKDLVKKSIKETKELNMYCMVDWHVLETNGHSGNPNDYKDKAKDFFGEISKYCADNGYDHVLYELCNEPTCGWGLIKSYAEEVIPVITANQEDAIIVVGTDSWCQKIMEPVSNPITSKYKKNVMYSFHYYACGHYHLLGDFRNAQKNIPVFVSEWSAVQFNGDGPFCKSNADEMVSDCDYKPEAPQVVSWCVWNWGKKDEASSFFKGSCAVGNESTYMDTDENYEYGSYIISLMDSGRCRKMRCCCGPWSSMNQIPSTETSLWHWDYYNTCGEGVSYHDANSSAWIKDSNGVVVDYSNEGEEVDIFSLAKTMQWIEKKCPWSKVYCGEIIDFDSTISTIWKDADGNPTHKSLNAGRNYSGPAGSARPNEGVDLNGANCLGTVYEDSRYTNLYLVEEDEWINYTVEVEKPGYYKISGIISSEYKAPMEEGEISILTIDENYNLVSPLRVPSDSLSYVDVINTFGFPKIDICADTTINVSDFKNCWQQVDAKSGDENVILCAFKDAGIYEINIEFKGDASGVGPLVFDWYGEIDHNDPILSVTDIESSKKIFSIYPNPTTGEFTVELVGKEEATVEVINMAGQVVASQRFEGTTTINNALAAGVYTVVVKSNGGVSTQKLVVK